MSLNSLETTFCKVPSFPLLTMILQNLAYMSNIAQIAESYKSACFGH